MNLGFLMDVSESMAGERLQTVKRTLHAARSLFQPTDKVTLVTFGDRSNVVVDHILLDEEGIQTFYRKIDEIDTAGCTNLSAGIESLIVTQKDTPFDAIVVLTDGIVNRGIKSTVGLQTMFSGFGYAPITAIGYGADHNRVLLRNLAVSTRGAYIYVDTESLMPMAMGDLISGIRKEVLRGAKLYVPNGWTCCEMGPASVVGNVVADRDYWMIYEYTGRGESEDMSITITDALGYRETLSIVAFSDCHDLQEQVLRCRVAKAISAISDDMEISMRNMISVFRNLTVLQDEIAGLPESMLARPLVLRMKAQIAEIMAYTSRDSDEILARMSSGVAYLSSQRGVTMGDPDTQVFSSQCQRMASGRVTSAFDNPTADA